ncbi:hypothetical protein PWY87_31595 [Kribbella solani]|uniref:hypothetical protein n=1 Tax=Kribbella solani TaxID=236067 RepID=UPI0029AB379C|nr:hypothetical protein [Kribbella solani]MDX2971166.1 hypothetical protein [Kribbella solani]MDX3006263.1 hypothetical protein [Kribbella solani]
MLGRTAGLRTVMWEEFRRTTNVDAGEASWGTWCNHYVSLEKARTRLGYALRYEPDGAILDSVRWLIERDQLAVVSPLIV